MEVIESQKKIRISLILLSFILFSITLIGLFWLLGANHPIGIALSYAAGLSMIFLPCTLPLVFIIVPLSMGKGYKKGLLMAILFGLGLTITITIYGIIVAIAGKWVGMDRATRTMFGIAGLAAFLFGLAELKLLKFRTPSFSGGIPQFIQRKTDYFKSFFMGLFLGNAGIGCPNPAFYVLLAYIATTGSIFSGAILGFVHGIGRATPLILISILAILGVNATSWISKKRVSIEKITGFALIIIGAFILMLGIFGMYWWESSIMHKSWNNLIAENIPKLGETEEAGIFFGVEVAPSEIEKYAPWAPWIVMLTLITISFIWYRCKFKQKRVDEIE